MKSPGGHRHEAGVGFRGQTLAPGIVTPGKNRTLPAGRAGVIEETAADREGGKNDP